jgi:hypothetical protein
VHGAASARTLAAAAVTVIGGSLGGSIAHDPERPSTAARR